jgi:hypothetical protein
MFNGCILIGTSSGWLREFFAAGLSDHLEAGNGAVDARKH